MSCPLGMVSVTGDAPCTEVANDLYSSDGRSWTACPSGTRTLWRGSKSFADCISKVSNMRFELPEIVARGIYKIYTLTLGLNLSLNMPIESLSCIFVKLMEEKSYMLFEYPTTLSHFLDLAYIQRTCVGFLITRNLL